NKRAAAIFALSRVNTAFAKEVLRQTLDDESVIVRTAAARAVGLAKDNESIAKLMNMVQKDKAPARRQAATALGQIQAQQAITALLHASKNPDDRFVEHAIIYALITIGKAEPLQATLNDTSVNMRKAALIALDQMDGSPLQKNQLVPFLDDKNDVLRNAGIWVALHHPDWSDVAVNFLAKQLSTGLTADQLSSLREMMVAFSGNSQLQKIMGDQLKDRTTPAARKIFLMDIIGASNIDELPAAWLNPLSSLLKGEDDELRSAVLILMESHSIGTLNKDLDQIINNPGLPAAFRLRAFSAKTKSAPELSAAQFQLLLEWLGPQDESPVRQSAVRVLTQCHLSNAQLLTLAKEQVAQADAFLLPGLISTFEKSNNEEVGKALVLALQTSTDRLGNLSVQDMRKLFSTYPLTVQSLAEPIVKEMQDQQAGRLLQLEQLEASLKRGDVGEGRKLFFGKATCFTCHAVSSEGGNFGPDLTNIGEIRSRHDLLEAIVYPGASFAREHETSKVITKTNTFTGIIKEQLPEAIVLATGPGTNIRIPRSEISSIELQTVSMMPPGLDKILSNQEMADLMAFLVSLPNGLGQIKSH
ncbi:MAG TPA: HEAT repeat domain-containing protein, partial [Agriterribacter sp.]|nr:HEAT repeat domain-containing protein [Agriterribacter sp.]